MMDIQDVLREMRSNRLVDADKANAWADAIEAAMREPVALIVKNQAGQIRLTTADGDAFDLFDNLGTKLYALPPDAAGEIERLKSDLHAAECEIEELRDSRDFYKRRCDALQKAQRHMRDPERKAVSDILANGKTAALDRKEDKG